MISIPYTYTQKIAVDIFKMFRTEKPEELAIAVDEYDVSMTEDAELYVAIIMACKINCMDDVRERFKARVLEELIKRCEQDDSLIALFKPRNIE